MPAGLPDAPPPDFPPPTAELDCSLPVEGGYYDQPGGGYYDQPAGGGEAHFGELAEPPLDYSLPPDDAPPGPPPGAAPVFNDPHRTRSVSDKLKVGRDGTVA